MILLLQKFIMQQKEDTHNLAIVLHTMDKKPYSELWDSFIFYFDKYFDKNIVCKKYFLNEELDINYDGWTQIKTGYGEWSDRLKRGLSQIDKEYVFYFQEDFWLFDYLKNDIVEICYKTLLDNDGDNIKIHKIDRSKAGIRLINEHVSICDRNYDYLISHQPSIWRKEFLIENLLDNENPWQNEINGSNRLRKKDFKIYYHYKDYYNAVMIKGKLNSIGLQQKKW